MCGRFTYRFTWSQLQTLMELLDWPSVELTPRFNVAPTQLAPVVREIGGGGGGSGGATRRTGAMLRWGLVPRWAAGGAGGESGSPSTRLINARAETVATKPAFREAFARRRCLVPISGFYEWKTLSDGKSKQPYWISRSDGQPFALAGLWEMAPPTIGSAPAGSAAGATPAIPDDPTASFTLITTTPNALMAPIHDRMPVIVSPQDYARWLDPSVTNSAVVESLLKPCDPKGYDSRAVGRSVSNPGLDHPGLLDPVEAMDRPAGYLF